MKSFYQENHFESDGKSICRFNSIRLTKYKKLVTCKFCLKKLSNENEIIAIITTSKKNADL